MVDPELEALYRDVVLDHFRSPRGRAPLPRPDARGLAVNPTCGDQVEVELALDGDRIAAVSARAVGCSIAVAAASVLTELVPGAGPEAVAALASDLEAIVHGRAPARPVDARLRAFAPVASLPSRQRCALLAWEAIDAALERARRAG